MKTNYKNLLCGIISITCASAMAQVSAYQFAQGYTPYVPLTGGTVVATATANTAAGNLGGTVWNLPNGSIPFSYTFNGIAYTGLNITSHGYITFGTTPPVATNGSPISAATAYAGCICAWGRVNSGIFNLQATVGTFSYTSEVRVEVVGTAPYRKFVIQWYKWRYSNAITTTATWVQDYQIRLHETTNIAEVIYGPGMMCGNGSTSTLGFNIQVGLRGATAADYNNRSGSTPFDASVAGTINTANQAIGISGNVPSPMPNPNLSYSWMPRCTGTPVTPTISIVSSTICAEDTLKFTATGETPYFDIQNQWKIGSFPGGPYTNVTAPPAGTTFATYNAVANGSFLYYVLVSTCPNVPASATSNEIFIDVRPLPVLEIVSSPALNTTVTPIETCVGETYTLTGLGASTYTWLGGPATDTYVVAPLGNPIYTLTGTSVDGCFASRDFDILVNPLPVMSMLGAPNFICPGNPAVIGVSGTAATYTWVGQNSNAFLISVTPSVTTTYTVLGTTVRGCTNVATQPIIVYTVTPVTAAASPTICAGEGITLSASGANSYVWKGLNTYATTQLVSVAPNITTTYTVTGTDGNGCESSALVVQNVSACTGLDGMARNLTGLQIYPNPNNGVFTVELNNGAAKTFDVMDVTGKVVSSTTTGGDTAEININGLAGGVYYIRVQSNNAVEVVKVVKQ